MISTDDALQQLHQGQATEPGISDCAVDEIFLKMGPPKMTEMIIISI